jgi:uncharacterized protein (UPF0261 family)
MEHLMTECRIDGVLDLITTELADELVCGKASAGPNYLTAAAKNGSPASCQSWRAEHGQFWNSIFSA